MDSLEFSDEFLKDANHYCSYDDDIPLQYRIVAKLLFENDLKTIKRFIETNKTDFNNEYNYLLLDMAVEHSIDIVVDENGKYHNYLSKSHIYKPTLEMIEFIEYLLNNGADPKLPIQFNQIEHIKDLEEDCGSQCECTFDCSEIIQLFQRYM